MNRHLTIQTPHGTLHGEIVLPPDARATVLLARSHHSPHDAAVSANLAGHGYAVLSMDLLTLHEAQFADATQNVPRLAQRLIDMLDLARRDEELACLPFGIFATGDASPAAIRTAAQRDTQIGAVACHGGHIDRAGKQSLEYLTAPFLLLGDAADTAVKSSYELARPHFSALHEFHELEMAESPIPRVTAWFSAHLGR